MNDPWQERGQCRDDHNPEKFFPHSRNDAAINRAVRVCWTCPVVAECAAHALHKPELFGVWGAMSEWDRQLVWRRWAFDQSQRVREVGNVRVG